MVAPFLNKDNFNENEDKTGTIICPKNILDLPLRDIIEEWKENMVDLISKLIEVFSNRNTLRWQDNYKDITNSLNGGRRILYLGVTLIFFALMLSFLELTF